ncbi:MAG TPA: transcription elongation factor GreA [Pseudogracilibacillus sp.]|nr:transcription elongation factor GreA [Pseudogracilibacillus sp.]
MAKKMQLTKKGFEQLKEELEQLENILRPKNKERIKRARGFCDFNEDSEYEAALTEQRKIYERIKELQYVLSQATIIEQKTKVYRVSLGSSVRVLDLGTGEQETFTIVRAEEADSFSGRISEGSPLGSALLGAKVNERLTVTTPNGRREIKIEKIS